MRLPGPLTRARFLKREKRFLIHALLADGQQVVAHTNNTGSMRGCLGPDAEIWLSPANNPRRKLRWTLELVRTVADPDNRVAGNVLVGINTLAANRLTGEALKNGLLPLMGPADQLRAEVKYGHQGSRVDWLITDPACAKTWVEVKNVSLVEDGHARFPDSPTERGRKHLAELSAMVAAGDHAALVFCIQREDARTVGPADDIDPRYGQMLREAAAAGVELFGLGCRVSPQAIEPDRLVAIRL